MTDTYFAFAKIPTKAFTEFKDNIEVDDTGENKYIFAFGELDKMKKIYYYVYLDVGYDVVILDEFGGVVKQSKGFRMEDLDEAKKKSHRSNSYQEFLLSKKSELEERARKLQEEGKA